PCADVGGVEERPCAAVAGGRSAVAGRVADQPRCDLAVDRGGGVSRGGGSRIAWVSGQDRSQRGDVWPTRSPVLLFHVRNAHLLERRDWRGGHLVGGTSSGGGGGGWARDRAVSTPHQ